jgi:hypothetical protein
MFWILTLIGFLFVYFMIECKDWSDQINENDDERV